MSSSFWKDPTAWVSGESSHCHLLGQLGSRTRRLHTSKNEVDTRVPKQQPTTHSRWVKPSIDQYLWDANVHNDNAAPPEHLFPCWVAELLFTMVSLHVSCFLNISRHMGWPCVSSLTLSTACWLDIWWDTCFSFSQHACLVFGFLCLTWFFLPPVWIYLLLSFHTTQWIS